MTELNKRLKAEAIEPDDYSFARTKCSFFPLSTLENSMPISAKVDDMNVALRQPMSLAEFLEWEERQPLRYEFDGFQPIAMTGGTRTHAAIQRNLAVALGARLRGTSCRFYGSDLKIEVAGRIRYPDGFVACAPGGPKDTVEQEPVVIFEVLSTSTASTDTVTKNAEYAATPSVRRYVILSQDVVGGQMFERLGDDWVGHVLQADAILAMPEIGLEIPLAEFYIDVEFQKQADQSE